MERLFFIYMPGCHVCSVFKPMIKTFRDRHPQVKVLPLDITAVLWEADKWMPQVTPTLIRLAQDGRYHVWDGKPDGNGRATELVDAQRWLDQHFGR